MQNPRHNPKIIIAKSSRDLSNITLQKWLDLGQQAIEQRGYFTAAISGGTGPISFYRRLAQYKNENFWARTHLFIVDERYVPLNHADSNFQMIRENLLTPSRIPENNVHPILTHHSDPEESAWEYEEELISFFHLKTGEFPVFDLIMLGVGLDGHTASLFPGTPGVQEKDRLIISAQPPSDVKHSRISLTLPVINQAQFVLVHVPGVEKSRILHRILVQKEALPMTQVQPHIGEVAYYLDRESASLLPVLDVTSEVKISSREKTKEKFPK